MAAPSSEKPRPGRGSSGLTTDCRGAILPLVCSHGASSYLFSFGFGSGIFWLLTVSEAGSRGWGKASQSFNRREGRREQGKRGTLMGHVAEREGEVPNLAPWPTWSLAQGSPFSGSLWCVDLGRPGFTCPLSLPVPHPRILSSSQLTPHLPSQATPCPQLRLLGQYSLLRWGSLQPFRQGLQPLGLGCAPVSSSCSPFGIQEHSQGHGLENR